MKILSKDKLEDFLKALEDRSDLDMTKVALAIIDKIRSQGDQALIDYTSQFDGVVLKELEVSQEEWQEGFEKTDSGLVKSLERASENIKNFHKIQIRESQFIESDKTTVGELINPLMRVGIYVPGGKAAYPSTVLMNAIPAKLAGVKEIVMVTPPMADGTIKSSVLAAARLAGVDKIYKVGGAQAVAALAYGTETINPVDKIVGPGNAYVAAAKSIVSNKVGIDMIAGPSEILILADGTSNLNFVARDLISQAEHDEKAAAIAIVTDMKLANSLNKKIEDLMVDVERKEIVAASLENEGCIIVVDSYDEMIDMANKIAPEHLEIMTSNPESLVTRITNAGAIFVGQYSPEALGDYYAGPNHTLPTSGTARFASPLGVDDFIKKTSYIRYSKEGLEEVKQDIIDIAMDEGLFGHANAIKVRFGG